MIQYETIGGEVAQRDAKALLDALKQAHSTCSNWDIKAWEDYLNAIDPNCMSLGHDRIREVAMRMHLFEDLIVSETSIVTVGGTNGKGSTSALIAAAMNNLNVKTGLFTSPHLFKFNERIQIAGVDISDELLSQCLSEVIQAQFSDNSVKALYDEAYIDAREEAEAQEESESDKYSDSFNSEDHKREYLGADSCGFGTCDSQCNDNQETGDNSSNSSDHESCSCCSSETSFADETKEALKAIQSMPRPLENDIVELSYFEITTLAAMRAFLRAGCELLADETKEALKAIQSMPRPLENDIVELSYFEITTLAAMRAFLRAGCELLVLEVGLGGRLDCVNIFYNDIAIITSIGLDHMKVLGDTTQKIAHEKAGIINIYGSVIVGSGMDDDARREIMINVKKQDATAFYENDSFYVKVVEKQDGGEQSEDYDISAPPMRRTHEICYRDKSMSFKLFFPYPKVPVACAGQDGGEQSEDYDISAPPMRRTHEICYRDKSMSFKLFFPYPKVPVACAGLALKAIFMLNAMFGIGNDYRTLKAIEDAVKDTVLPGRMQHVGSEPDIYLDVAHNVPAAVHLRDRLLATISNDDNAKQANPAEQDKQAWQSNQSQLSSSHKRIAVIGMLKDKDIEGVLEVISSSFDAFYVASLPGLRGESKERLAASLTKLTNGAAKVQSFDSVADALKQAQSDATKDDTIIVMGSFVTVAEASRALA